MFQLARREKVSQSVDGGPVRDYFVTFTDDPPERAEAVAFFSVCGTYGLWPAISLPDGLASQPLTVAQHYLDTHPTQEKWEGLAIHDADPVNDEDLRRLKHIPELTRLKIYSNAITDAGIIHLQYLTHIEILILASSKITDRCLELLATLKTLRMLDMQRASAVSRSAYSRVAAQLPCLRDIYPPFDTA